MQEESRVEKLSKEKFQELIRRQVYQSRELIEGHGGYHIRRGMAHAISGYCEDVFALYVAQYLNNPNLKFFVDKVISTKFPENAKSTSFKPDLAIINENNVLTHYFDLKTNLGWNRKLEGYLTKKNEFILNLKKHKSAWVTSKWDWLDTNDFNTKYPLNQVENLTIHDDLKYHMVVVFDGNMNEKDMVENYEIADSFKDNIAIDVLFQKGEINNDAFNNIHDALTKIYKSN